MKCVAASSPLSSTGVAVDVQKAFHDALHAEQAFQAGLMMLSLTINGDYVYQRNIGLELLILQAKMRRARAEIELYTVTVENARQFDFSDNMFSSIADIFQVHYRLPVDLFHDLNQMNCLGAASSVTM